MRESSNTREIKFRGFIEIGNNSEIKAMIPDVVFLGHSLSCDTESFNEAIKPTGYQYDSGDCVFIGEGKEPIEADEFNFSDYEGDFVYFEGEVMQFTGLKDKNGKEIYEGDIVRKEKTSTPEYVGEVFYTGVRCAFAVRYDRPSGYLRYADLVKCKWSESDGFCIINPEGDRDETHEVIGNIYENPDLLTK